MFVVNEVVGDVWAWDARLVTNVTGEKKNRDQPVLCNQFCTGNSLSFFASFSESKRDLGFWESDRALTSAVRGSVSGEFP